MKNERKKLNQIRKENKMTFQQVADAVGVTKPFYWQIEKGQRGLSYELAVKIAAVFNMNPDDIFLPEELTKSEQAATSA